MNFSLWYVLLASVSGFDSNGGLTPQRFELSEAREQAIYENIRWPDEKPEFEVFLSAVSGYQTLQDSLHLFKKPFLTVIDFSRPSTAKRLWVIDLEKREVVLNSLVAHGRNSGEIMATRFSNRHESFQSSLGFYVTGNTYVGRHGLSLILKGLEDGINDQAASRAIVVHGADYVSEHYVKFAGRLGRSQGCPAVPMDTYKKLIGIIKDQTCLFIYAPVDEYVQHSKLLPNVSADETLTLSPTGKTDRF